jgi:hypothetical protein
VDGAPPPCCEPLPDPGEPGAPCGDVALPPCDPAADGLLWLPAVCESAGGVGQVSGRGVPADPSVPCVPGDPSDGEFEPAAPGAPPDSVPAWLDCSPDWLGVCGPDPPGEGGGEPVEGDCDGAVEGDCEGVDAGDEDGLGGSGLGIEVELLVLAQPPAASAAVSTARLARPVDRCMKTDPVT